MDYTTLMLDGFEKRKKPSNFLTNLAKKTVSKQTKVELDTRAIKNVIAMDVAKGTGGRLIDMSKFSTYEYEPPQYNEFTRLTSEDFDKRAFGKNKYEAAASAIDLINDRQSVISDMVRRAEEKQASDALFNGSITLVDKSVITFNKKSTHAITPTTKWTNPAAAMLDDISNACNLCNEDGLVGASLFNLIVAEDVLPYIFKNADFQAQAKMEKGIERVLIKMPEEITTGATFHGQFSAGSFKINLFTYPQKYEIPVGYGFAGEGTSTPYIPKGAALLLPVEIRFDMFYGGLSQVGNAYLTGDSFTGGVDKVAMEQLAYSYKEIIAGEASVIAGLKSKPLFIPTNIDGFATFSGLLA